MFSVAMLAREEPGVLLRSLSHFRALGAERIFLFHDGAMPDNTDVSEFGPDVDLEVLTEDFWIDKLGPLPHDFQDKQRAAYRKAIDRNQSDWLFLCDADEMIINHRDLYDVLLSVPTEVESLSIPTAEAFWAETNCGEIDDAFSCRFFRRPLGPLAWRVQRRFLYPRTWHLMQANLLGHAAGKQFLRRGAVFSHLTSHVAFRGNELITQGIEKVTGPDVGLELAHFDAISFPRWLEKFRRRITGDVIQGRTPARKKQRDALSVVLRGTCSWEGQARALFSDLYTLNSVRYEILQLQKKAFQFNVA